MGWYIAQTEPNREEFVDDRLHEVGFNTWLPRIQAAGRPAPLFPGYIIIEFGPGWTSVRWRPRVVRVLMSGELPAMLPEPEVDKWRRRERKGPDGTMVIRLPKKQPTTLQRGQKVRITTGNFSGLNGLYQEMLGNDRVRVLLDLLGQKVPVQMPVAHVQAQSVA